MAVIATLANLVSGCGGDGPGGPDEPVVASVEVRLGGSAGGTLTLIAVGDTVRLEARALSANGSVIQGKSFTWTSSNEAVVTVDGRGLVTAIGPGSSTVTARADGVSGSVPVEALPPAGGPVDLTWTFCAPPDVPLWFAAQDGTGPWMQVAGVPSADGVSFTFSIGERGGVAFKKPFVFLGEAAPVTVFYGTRDELAALQDVRCGFAGRKTLSGTFTGVYRGPVLSIGAAAYDVNGSFTLEHVPDGPQDLLAADKLSDATPGEVPTHVILRRGLDLPDHGVIPTLDFSSSEAFPVGLHPLTVVGAEFGTPYLSMWYLMSNSSTAWDPAPVSATNGPFLFFDNAQDVFLGVPPSRQQPGDLHLLHVDDGGSQGSVNRSKEVFTFFHTAGPRTVHLGPPLNPPNVELVATAPYLRYRVRLPVQSNYGRLIWVVFRACGDGSQDDRGAEVAATAGYFGGSVTTWDVGVPDFTAAGVDPGWLPQSGETVEWDVQAFDWSESSGISLVSPIAWLFGPPADGAEVRSARVGVRPGC